jgi:glycosyltransferase involved in cell wall biosynthesis
VSLSAYARQVLTRFGNPALPDTVARVASDGAAKLPAFVRATADELLRGGDVRRLALLVAAFRSYVNGYDGRCERVASEPNLQDRDWRLLPAAAARGFILAMGRAVPYKGWDDLLDALHLARPVPHTLLAAVTDDPEATPYQAHLARRIDDEHLDVTLVTRFHPGIRTLLAHPALAALVVPSRVEPFGRIPMEAYVAGAAPVVATRAGGLAELVVDGCTGFTAAPADPASLADALRQALDAGPAERARLRVAGRSLVAARYNYERNVGRFLNMVAPWAAEHHAAQGAR